MIRFYIMPIELRGLRLPKYFAWSKTGETCPPYFSYNWSMKDYGSINMGVLCADITQVNHDALILNSDVYAFPENLDVTMTVAERGTLNTYLEANAIPGDWLSPTDTFRSALRIVTAMFLYLQRVLAMIGYPTDPFTGLTLNTQYRNIPNPLHDALQQGAISLGYTWNVANNTQVRRIFKLMADQWADAPIYFGLATL